MLRGFENSMMEKPTKRVKDSPISRGYKNPMKKSNLNTAVSQVVE